MAFSTQAKKATTTLVVVVAVVGLSYFAGQGFGRYDNTRAKTTAKTFVTDLNTSKLSEAYALTSANVKRNSAQAKFVSTFNDLAAPHPVYTNESVIVTGNKAVYSVDVAGLSNTRTGVTKGNFALSLIRQGLNWQIDSISVQ